MAERFDNFQIMRDKKIGQIMLYLQVTQQIENLGLDGAIKRRSGLVENNQLRF